jgi:hypothetical protein
MTKHGIGGYRSVFEASCLFEQNWEDNRDYESLKHTSFLSSFIGYLY